MIIARTHFKTTDVQSLQEHSLNVAATAAAALPQLARAAYLGGYLHDAEKAALDWQRYVRGATATTVPHSAGGAALLIDLDPQLKPIAAAVAAHHAGLRDNAELTTILREVSAERRAEIKQQMATTQLSPDHAAATAPPTNVPLQWSDTPFLAGAIIRADRLDAERWNNVVNNTPQRTHNYASLDDIAAAVAISIAALPAHSPAAVLRREARADLMPTAQQPRGLYTLTLPTGLGKTYLCLSWALAHAKQHNLHRIVVAAPFNSLAEQTATAYKRAGVPEDSLLQHYGDAARDGDIDDWSEPVVLTSTAQLFTSLMSRRPNQLRKLPSLLGAVVVIDEVQTLPPRYRKAIVKLCADLVRLGSTVVLSTATQPLLWQGTGEAATAKEIMPRPDYYAAETKRLRGLSYNWTTTPLTTQELAQRVKEDSLVICHTRADASSLHVELLSHRTPAWFLSASMCPAHREDVLDSLRAAMQHSQAVLVSTQLALAGLDLDFAHVFVPDSVGLDGVQQAAGRCNREGRRHHGTVNYYVPATAPPPGLPQKARELLRRSPPSGDDLDVTAYFTSLYGRIEPDHKDTAKNHWSGNFETAARSFHFVEDSYSTPMIIPFDETARRLIAQLQRKRVRSSALGVLRQLRRYTVAVSDKNLRGLAGKYDTVSLPQRLSDTDDEVVACILRAEDMDAVYTERGLTV
jgi:CRISPR-associated endonuclease/helicase Cas3